LLSCFRNEERVAAMEKEGYSLRLLNEQHELIESQEREILGLKVDVATQRTRIRQYQDRIIELELTKLQKLGKRLLEGRKHEEPVDSTVPIHG